MVHDFTDGNRQLVDFRWAPTMLTVVVPHVNPAPVHQVLYRETHFRLPHVGSPFDCSGRCLGDIGEEDKQLRDGPFRSDSNQEIGKFLLPLGKILDGFGSQFNSPLVYLILFLLYR